jgi:hypothetical protein
VIGVTAALELFGAIACAEGACAAAVWLAQMMTLQSAAAARIEM